MTIAISCLLASASLYLLVSLVFTYLVQAWPRRPVVDMPDWGTLTDTTIPTVNGKFLEVWRVEPDAPSRGIVLLVHGWGRNRDRMVTRARIFASLGYTTVLHSARDHGASSPQRFMNAHKFAEDIEAVLDWLGEPVLLYGHSAGAGGAIIAAHGNPQRVKLLFLEACYTDTRTALMNLYRWANPLFGKCFGPAILWWMTLFYGRQMDDLDPVRLARDIRMPVMILHGEADRRFPVAFAHRLRESFPEPDRTELFIARGAHHSETSHSPLYPGVLKAFLSRFGPGEGQQS
jgi:pimeloyl-ACP methyl ester carboxylesterase